jgi:hypothetical protein
MKDFFGTFESLDQCPRVRLEPLIAAIRQQQEQAREGGGRPTAEQAAENEERFQNLTLYREETAYDPQSKRLRPEGELEGGETKSYFTRARENSEHFFGGNLETGFAEIGQALNLLARAAGLQGEARSELQRQAEGHLYTSFHLFTDALSAGHMVHGQDMRQAGQEFWGQHKGEIVAHLSTALLRKYPWASRLMNPWTLHGVIQRELLSFLPDKIDSLLLKLEHDRLGQGGLWLANRRGHIWLGLGDDGLARSPGTQLIGPLLVAEVIERFDRFKAALDAGQNPSLTYAMMKIEQGILDLLPSQVEWGGHYVPLKKFAEDKSRFLASIQEQVMQDAPERNKLLQLMLHHSTLLWQQLEEKVMKSLAESEAHEQQHCATDPDSDFWKRQIQ